MREGTGPLVDHLLAVNDRINELKPGWPCGKKQADPGTDVLRLVPREVLQAAPFGPHLRESNDRLGALQARALVRLVA
jgi:hypothetical protein